jgi:uncharacterized LabA/DUF88 family protein/cold shock CspA family protein
MKQDSIVRIGVFVDGGYLNHISNYYRFSHPKQARISITGLKSFIRNQVATAEGADESRCHIVEAHYYRGRISASEALARDVLYHERQFDDVLAFAGFQCHYQPVSGGKEKGVDVLLAIDAFEKCSVHKLDFCVLVTGDSDFIPLVRKLHAYGSQVMVLGWNTMMIDEEGNEQETRCSFHLLQEAAHAIHVHELLEQTPAGANIALDGLFFRRPSKPLSTPGALSTPSAPSKKAPTVSSKEIAPTAIKAPATPASEPTPVRSRGIIYHLQENYGFILRSSDDKQFFFHANELLGVTFASLHMDDNVSFVASTNDQGRCARSVQPL